MTRADVTDCTGLPGLLCSLVVDIKVDAVYIWHGWGGIRPTWRVKTISTLIFYKSIILRVKFAVNLRKCYEKILHFLNYFH